MIVSSIDIGSNSTILYIGDFENHKLSSIYEEVTITSLGKNLDSEMIFSQESMRITFETLQRYSQKISEYGVQTKKVIVTATEASRVAKNAKNFFEHIRQQIGFDVIVLSGEGEAFYTNQGVLLDPRLIKAPMLTIVDIGGASTELIKVDVETQQIIRFHSLPVGAVRARDWIDRNTYKESVASAFASVNASEDFDCEIVGVAGTITTVAALILDLKYFEPTKISGLTFSITDINNFLNRYSHYSPQLLLQEFPILGKRCENIIAGCLVLKEVLTFLKKDSFSVSTFGLRHGTAASGTILARYVV